MSLHSHHSRSSSSHEQPTEAGGLFIRARTPGEVSDRPVHGTRKAWGRTGDRGQAGDGFRPPWATARRAQQPASAAPREPTTASIFHRGSRGGYSSRARGRQPPPRLGLQEGPRRAPELPAAGATASAASDLPEPASDSDGSPSGEPAAQDQLDTADDGAQPDSTTMTMLHCLFAMVFAACTLAVLTFVGVAFNTTTNCPAQQGYSWCSIWQDFRSVLSFVLGACLCCFFTNGKERTNTFRAPPERSEKVQLYAYML